jgi:hypothetical protein
MTLLTPLLAGLTSLGVAAPVRGLAPAGPEAPAHTLGYDRQVALVVGISDYPGDALDLAHPVADAQAVAQRLRERFGFDEVVELYDEAATREAVLDALQSFSTLGPDDALLVFWAGHGTTTTTPTGERLGYLVPHDGSLDPERAIVDNLSMQSVRTVLGRGVPARHRLLVVDACYGGILATRAAPQLAPHDAAWLSRNLQRDAFQVLTAGQADETVLDVGPDGHSVFTARLLAALDEEADFRTASELSVQVQREVRQEAFLRGHLDQTPAFGHLQGSGEFVFLPSGEELAALPTVRRRSRALAWSAGGIALLGGAGLALAAQSRAAFQQGAVADGSQDGLVRWNHAAGATGIASLAVAGGLAAGAVWVAEW